MVLAGAEAGKENKKILYRQEECCQNERGLILIHSEPKSRSAWSLLRRSDHLWVEKSAGEAIAKQVTIRDSKVLAPQLISSLN